LTNRKHLSSLNHRINQKKMLAKSSIKFHEGETPIKLYEDWHFGVFQLEVEKTEMTEKPQEIHIMLDKSGSMDEICSDRFSKIDQIKHVTKNILHFVKDKHVSIGVSVFNSTVSTVFPKTEIQEDNIDKLIASVDKIYAKDETNIAAALQAMHSLSDGGIEHHNIFMTDGDATVGESRPSELLKMVDNHATSNTFVGFGTDHNPEIFLTLSDADNSSYYFVDKIEKSGLAYGEILHNILYNCVQNVKITIYNGLIYDWKSNEWLADITIGSLASEAKKTFQFVAPNMSEVIIVVTGSHDIHETFMHKGVTEDLMKMFFRQKTQEYLYLAKAKPTDKASLCEKATNWQTQQALAEAYAKPSLAKPTPVNNFKKEIAQFTREMKEYMKTHNLTDDIFMKNLCDDLVVVYKTIGTRYASMYSSARQTSQGNERLFNVCDTPTRCVNNCEPDENDSLMWTHSLSDDSPYYTEQLAGVMRDVSTPQRFGLARHHDIDDPTLADGSLLFPQLCRLDTTSGPLTIDDLCAEYDDTSSVQRTFLSRSTSE